MSKHRDDMISTLFQDPVPRNSSIWTVSDINTYTEAKLEGDLALHFLLYGHLVSSSLRQDHNPGFTEQHLPSVSDFMSDLEPNVRIRDENNQHLYIDLFPNGYGPFSIEKLHRE